MTRDEVKKIVMLLKAAYPSFVPKDEAEARARFALWESYLISVDYKDAEWCVRRCIESCVLPPTIADMNQYLRLTKREEPKLLAMPEPVYSNAAYIESKFEKAMRAIEEKGEDDDTSN